MPVREREHGELPSPICPGLTARLGRDLLFFPLNFVTPPFIVFRRWLECFRQLSQPLSGNERVFVEYFEAFGFIDFEAAKFLPPLLKDGLADSATSEKFGDSYANAQLISSIKLEERSTV
jgi:hypothetical protein